MSRNTMKKILSIALVGLLLLGISACGKTVGTGSNPETKISQETKKDQKESAATKKDKNTAKEDPTTKSDNSTEQQNSANGSENTAGSGTNTNSGNSSGGSSSGNSSQPATPAPTEPPAPSWTITVTVDGCEYGGVFASGTYTYPYQPNAFDALVSTGLGYTGSGNYVRSINGLAEFDHGRFSGWLYSVNGVEPNVGCGSYYLNDGDSVYWHYQGDE